MAGRFVGAEEERLQALGCGEGGFSLREGGTGKQRGGARCDEGEAGISHTPFVGIATAVRSPSIGGYPEARAAPPVNQTISGSIAAATKSSARYASE